MDYVNSGKRRREYLNFNITSNLSKYCTCLYNLVSISFIVMIIRFFTAQTEAVGGKLSEDRN